MGLGSRELDAALDRWLTTPPEPKESKFKCERCGSEFFPDDEYYVIEGEKLCDSCADDWLLEQRKIASFDDCFED